MRMTNKIMQNNSLYNINNNKILQDKLSTMMSTQKKITRPSDDPVIAIRALRLRTSVSELTQYYEKNAPDAESWLDVTAGALGTVTEVITNMSKIANRAANKEYGSEDLQVFVEQLKALRDEFYATGNVDYAGRYIFTGYRTDTTLSFTEEVEKEPQGYPRYEITEQKSINDFDTITYTDVGRLGGLNKNNYQDYIDTQDPANPGTTLPNITDQDVTKGDIHRLRLSYDDLSAGKTPTIKYAKMTDADATAELKVGDTATLPDGTTVTLADGVETTLPAGTEVTNAAGDTITLTAESTFTLTGTATQTVTGKVIEAETLPVTTVSVTAKPDPYQTALADENAIVFVPETGEILFGSEAYKAVSAKAEEGVEVRVSYEKDSWKDGDLRPEHYFFCTKTSRTEDGKDKTINYNHDNFAEKNNRQTIEYDVGYNQKIQINTTADEVFTHNLDRDIDDLERALADLVEIDATMTDLDNILTNEMANLPEDDPTRMAVQKQYNAAKKAYDYTRENIHDMFQGTITKMQGYLDDTDVAITDNGTRSQRLDLISNRLMDQRTTFKTLQSENEDIDIAEVVIQLTSTELTYNAALMATGKIMQTSLMNYI